MRNFPHELSWLRDGCVMVAWSVTSSLLPLFHVIEKSLWSDLVHVCGRLILFFWGGGEGRERERERGVLFLVKDYVYGLQSHVETEGET